MATKTSVVSRGVDTTTAAPAVSQAARSEALRLLCVTATGPVYEGRVAGVVIPMSSFLALLQEVAAKAADPKAQVVSSLAQRVSGADALGVWDGLGVGFGIRLAGASREVRLAVLSEVLEYIRREGRVDGIEAAVAATVNAAWPYVRPQRLARVLSIIERAVSKSTFTDKHGVSIVDPIARTMTKVAAGRFKLLDPIGWLDWAELSIPEWRLWLPNDAEWGVEFGPSDQELGQLGIGDSTDLPGSLGGWGSSRGSREIPGRSAPQRRPRPGGQTGPGFGNVGTSGGLGGRFGVAGDDSDLLGGLGIDGYDSPGPQDLGDLGGGSGRPSFDRGGAGRGIGLGGLGGFGAGPNTSGAFGGPLGGRFSGGDFGKQGGPLGFGGGMGPGGASDWVSEAEKSAGWHLVFGGFGATLLGEALGAAMIGVGGILISDANHRGDVEQHDRERAADLAKHDRERAEDKEAEKRREEKHDRERAEDKAAEAKKAEESKVPTVTPQQLPNAPKQGDKYPDPHKKGGHLPAGDGTVDPIDPRMRPAGDDGLGPIDPRMLPVGDFEHGGDPTTLWEEDGGGVTPTTVGRRVTSTTLGGPGLKAAIVQIDPHTFTF